MKKQFFLLTSLLIAAFFTLKAQSVSANITATSTSEHSAKAAIHPVILANFQSQYPNANGDKWATTGKGYLVRFLSNDIDYTVFLNKKGKMTGQIRCYHEKDLPTNVLKTVRGYNGLFTVGLIQEVTTANGTAYLVTIEEGGSWKVLRVVSGQMDVIEDYKKG